MKKIKVRDWFFLFLIVVILVAAIIGNVVCYYQSGVITTALCGTGVSFEGENVQEALEEGDELCREMGQESIVLLKNNNTLPLPAAETKVNLFGYGACDNGFALRGIGSGSSSISDDSKVTLTSALNEAGISYNTEIVEAYDRLGWVNSVTAKSYVLQEPTIDFYSQDMIARAKSFSGTAIVVISRIAGENMQDELPRTQSLRTEKGTSTDNTRTNLQLSVHEEDLLDLVCENFANVIVLVNTSNAMHLGYLQREEVDAVLYVGLLGQSGAAAIPDLLYGKASPSGKITDTYAYAPETAPSFVNFWADGSSVQYVEDIYFGYKWFETADAENFWDDIDNEYGKGYEGVVQYPFGYGLSYTTFDWEATWPLGEGASFDSDETFTVKVSVTNTGSVAGKDVVEIYATPPYIAGGIEKSAVTLVAFAKTGLLKPGESEELTLSFDAYALASYDCYDRNANGYTCYELDPGDYVISLRTDAHTVKSGLSRTFTLDEELLIDADPVTGSEIANRLTDADAYAGLPIDGSTVGAETVYLSRADFAGTMPKAHAVFPKDPLGEIKRANEFYNDVYNTDSMPTTGVDSGLRLTTREDGSFATYNELSGSSSVSLVANEELIEELTDYDSPTWDKFMDQLTTDEIVNLVQFGGFGTRAAASVGKPAVFDTDGPAGFNDSVLAIDSSASSHNSGWTAYPSESLLGCSWDTGLLKRMGEAIGFQGYATNVSGWYAPGVNLHHSPYTGRNFEYYSEDALLSGKLAANVIAGAREYGVYCYIKHFAVSELGINPQGVNTWLTEQNLRENYLRPFEIAVKEGKANAVMTAFNRIGAVWAGANYATNVQILRDEWGFRGCVITDYSTGGGVGLMNIRQGIRAGNDLWLNPNTVTQNPMDRDDPTDLACAKAAAKNILYTYVSSYSSATGLRDINSVFAWWIIVLVGADIVIAASLTIWTIYIFKPKRSKKKKDESGVGETQGAAEIDK